MTHLPALVTLFTILLMFGTTMVVGRARVRYGIKAPATSGDPAFDRAYRVQMNTLEQTVMFLPLLWLAANYGFTGWAGMAGLVWLVGRIWYALAYLKDPAKRGPGFGISMLAQVALLIMAVVGITCAMMVG